MRVLWEGFGAGFPRKTSPALDRGARSMRHAGQLLPFTRMLHSPWGICTEHAVFAPGYVSGRAFSQQSGQGSSALRRASEIEGIAVFALGFYPKAGIAVPFHGRRDPSPVDITRVDSSSAA